MRARLGPNSFANGLIPVIRPTYIVLVTLHVIWEAVYTREIPQRKRKAMAMPQEAMPNAPKQPPRHSSSMSEKHYWKTEFLGT